MTQMKRVHLVDDEEAVRRSVGFLLRTSGFEVELWADGETFLKNLDDRAPACVLLDMRMGGLNGLQVQAAMAKQGLFMPVIIITGHGDVQTAVAAMQAGAVEFIEKPFDNKRLMDALELGFTQIENQHARVNRENWARTLVAQLSKREAEVLNGLACGYPNKTIAYDLGISPRTVEVYRANIMAKFGASNFADVLRVAFAAGLGIEPDLLSGHSVTSVLKDGSDSQI